MNNFEVFKKTECQLIAGKDAQYYGIDGATRDRYVKVNNFNYYVTTNLWYLLIKDISGQDIPEIRNFILKKGLIPAIAEAEKLSDALIHNQNMPSSPFLLFVQSLGEDPEDLYQCLEGLRFPKRFSPDAPFLADAEIAAFKQRQNSAKMKSRRELSPYLISMLKPLMTTLFKNYKVGLDYTPVFEPRPGVDHTTRGLDLGGSFPLGASADCGKSLTSKLLRIEEQVPLFLPNLPTYPTVKVGADLVWHYLSRAEAQAVDPVYDAGTRKLWKIDHNSFCKISPVPKTWKSLRIIGSEEVLRQYLMDRHSKAIELCLMTPCDDEWMPNGRVNLHDDSRQHDLARRGSIGEGFATVDLSAASDSILPTLIREVVPAGIVRVWDALRAKYVRYSQTQQSTNYLYSTMGSRITFPLQTGLYWCITVMAVRMHNVFAGTCYTADSIGVYGDDIICPDEVVPLLNEILTALGFTMNEKKTFYSGNYRESCGGEYFCGYNVASKILPRKTLKEDTESLVTLIEVQHRLVSYRTLNNFLTELLLSELKGNATFAPIGHQSYSLWSNYQPYRLGNPPVKKGESVPDELQNTRILVTVVKTEYGEDSKDVVTADAAERLAYYRFLKHGPVYSSPLDELLGVSQPPVKRAAYSTRKPELKLKNTWTPLN